MEGNEGQAVANLDAYFGGAADLPTEEAPSEPAKEEPAVSQDLLSEIESLKELISKRVEEDKEPPAPPEPPPQEESLLAGVEHIPTVLGHDGLRELDTVLGRLQKRITDHVAKAITEGHERIQQTIPQIMANMLTHQRQMQSAFDAFKREHAALWGPPNEPPEIKERREAVIRSYVAELMANNPEWQRDVNGFRKALKKAGEDLAPVLGGSKSPTPSGGKRSVPGDFGSKRASAPPPPGEELTDEQKDVISLAQFMSRGMVL